MLSDFFRINMPYGLKRNEKGEWHVFNREYMPIGFNSIESFYSHKAIIEKLPIHTKYVGLTEKVLLSLSDDRVKRNDNGELIMIWLYNDQTNPTKENNQYTWNWYFAKLQQLANLQNQSVYP